MLFSFWMNGSDRENTAIFFRWSGMTGKHVHCQMWKHSCKNFGRVFQTKSLANCDVHPAESLFKHIPEPVKMLWQTKRLHTKQKQVILPLLKGE